VKPPVNHEVPMGVRPIARWSPGEAFGGGVSRLTEAVGSQNIGEVHVCGVTEHTETEGVRGSPLTEPQAGRSGFGVRGRQPPHRVCGVTDHRWGVRVRGREPPYRDRGEGSQWGGWTAHVPCGQPSGVQEFSWSTRFLNSSAYSLGTNFSLIHALFS
jgi:hypothetical protein